MGNDCNSNGVPDECDTDCDASGLPDDCEELDDCDGNGTPDACEPGEDCNGSEFLTGVNSTATIATPTIFRTSAILIATMIARQMTVRPIATTMVNPTIVKTLRIVTPMAFPTNVRTWRTAMRTVSLTSVKTAKTAMATASLIAVRPSMTATKMASPDECEFLGLEAVCWGRSDENQCASVSGPTYRLLDAGRDFTVGLSLDGDLFAWGVNGDGQTDLPDIQDVREVSAGWWHALALLDDGQVVGWGPTSLVNQLP